MEVMVWSVCANKLVPLLLHIVITLRPVSAFFPWCCCCSCPLLSFPLHLLFLNGEKNSHVFFCTASITFAGVVNFNGRSPEPTSILHLKRGVSLRLFLFSSFTFFLSFCSDVLSFFLFACLFSYHRFNYLAGTGELVPLRPV